jgi:hypothetical protein
METETGDSRPCLHHTTARWRLITCGVVYVPLVVMLQDLQRRACAEVVFFLYAFSFMNSKRYKPMLQAEGGSGARVLFVRCGLPTSN